MMSAEQEHCVLVLSKNKLCCCAEQGEPSLYRVQVESARYAYSIITNMIIMNIQSPIISVIGVLSLNNYKTKILKNDMRRRNQSPNRAVVV